MIVSQSAQLPSSRGREIVTVRGDTGLLSATRVDVLDAILLIPDLSGLSSVTEILSTITTDILLGISSTVIAANISSDRVGTVGLLFSAILPAVSNTSGLVFTTLELFSD